MKIEIINGQRVETPDEGCWLHDGKPDYTRRFTTIVCLGVSDTPWPECTQAEREQWEEEHKPKSPELQTVESVEQPTD